MTKPYTLSGREIQALTDALAANLRTLYSSQRGVGMSGIDDISEDEQAYWELLAETNGLIKKLETDLAEQVSINEAIRLLNVSIREQLAEAQTNATFYKCCALSGEIPTDGSEPFPTSKVKR